MSYGVALRNGVPFTLGTIAALCVNATTQWNPRSLWPDGIATPGMWISPRTLTSQWQDYTGTTPVATPGTVADSANPVGLALDIRAGATVLTDPGNHMLQSTSVDRPLLSARVNLLTYTEDFSNAYWFTQNLTRVDDAVTAPDGSLTDLFYPTSSGIQRRVLVTTFVPSGTAACQSIYVKSAGKSWVFLTAVNAAVYADNCWFDVTNGVLGTVGANAIDAAISDAGNGWWRISAAGFGGTADNFYLCLVDADGSGSVTASGTDGIYVWHPQLEYGTTATPYQPILTDGSSYPSTGITPFQLYDGVDDGMATASFTAGTLINGMDCMIPVRRDSGSNCVAGLYNGVSDANKFFGMAESASGSGCVGSGAGTPTVWVDNTQLTGGTAVTRGTLHTALTTGSYHILEFRNLDLSTWTATGFGLYSSYVFPGARGDIMLYPSTASTEDKDAARQYLADKYGVTLA